MPANVDGMVREGISAYRAGRKDEARALLMRAVEIDQYNEQAWLWLSAVVESADEQRTCLENVLTINPNNERARQGLQILSQKSTPGASKPAAAHADDILASTSFTAPPAPSPTLPVSPVTPQVSPFGATTPDDELPTSIEWETQRPPTATSSASSQRRVDEPSPTEYDDWVSNLNLGTSTGEHPVAPGALQDDAARFIATPFDDEEPEDFVASLGISDVGDIFSAGPFTADEQAGGAPAASRVTSPAPRRTTDPLTSPGAELPTGRATADQLLDSIESDDELDTAFAEDYDQMELEKLEADEFFKYIPKEIKATRMPGTRERYPFLVILGLLLVIALNVGAITLFVLRMTGS